MKGTKYETGYDISLDNEELYIIHRSLTAYRSRVETVNMSEDYTREVGVLHNELDILIREG